MNRFIKALLSGAAVAAMALTLVACDDDDGAPAAASSATVSGTVVKGPINGATVNIYAADATTGAKGSLLTTTTTGAGGTYNATVAQAGPVLVEVTGGTYVDEATGTTKTLSETMRVMVTATAGGTVTGIVTPLTTAAYALGQVGGTGTNVSIATYNAALTSIATQFNLTGTNLVTTVPSVTGTTNAYGQILRAVSQYVASGGTLNTFLTWTSPTSFSGSFSTAYGLINGVSYTFNFNANGVTTGNVNVGGGAGTCGVNVKGTVSTGGFSAPVDTTICLTGIPEGSCTDTSQNVTQSISSNAAFASWSNLTVKTSGSCTP